MSTERSVAEESIGERDTMEMSNRVSAAGAVGKPRVPRAVPVGIAVGTVIAVLAGQALFHHATANTASTLASAPRDVTVVRAQPGTYRARRRYVGTLEPWVEARIGPQVLSAYVRTVGVRPGDRVRGGDVLATLDCRSASASSRAMAAEARSHSEWQAALSDEARRVESLVGTGYVSDTEATRRNAQSTSEQARADSALAALAGSRVAVGDCALRAPFAGDIGARFVDPGAFASPGHPLLTLVDRSVVRAVVAVPETEYGEVAPGTNVTLKVLSTHRELTARIARRSPEADPSTRTIDVEIDIPDPDNSLPIHTTAEIWVDVGEPVPANIVPLVAAKIRDTKAQVFLVEGDRARAREVNVLGEADGVLYLEPSLPNGANVVTAGRTRLHDGDRVSPRTSGTVAAIPPSGSSH